MTNPIEPSPNSNASAAADAPRVFQTLDRVEGMPYPLSERLKRAVWSLVNQTIWKMPRAWGWRRFLLRQFGAKVGNNSIFRGSARVFHPWLLEVGDFSTLAAKVVIYNLGQVTIGSHTVISQGSYICAGTHDYSIPTLPLQRPPISIGSGVWIAAEAFVSPNVTIGDNCVIGARAVVTKNIPPGVVAAGNPARVIKDREMNQAV